MTKQLISSILVALVAQLMPLANIEAQAQSYNLNSCFTDTTVNGNSRNPYIDFRNNCPVVIKAIVCVRTSNAFGGQNWPFTVLPGGFHNHGIIYADGESGFTYRYTTCDNGPNPGGPVPSCRPSTPTC